MSMKEVFGPVIRFFRSLRPELWFLVLGTLFGSAMAVVTPPFQAPDEANHFNRAYSISQGQIVLGKDTGGAFMPKSLQTLFFAVSEGLQFHPERKQDPKRLVQAFRIPLRQNEKIFILTGTVAAYSPVIYAPHVTAILLGRLLNLPLLAIFYLVRLFSLLAWLLLTAAAIRVAPYGKIFLLTASLMPMPLFLAASCSPDGTILGVSALFFAFLFRLALRPALPSRGEWLLLALFCGVLALCKSLYILLAASLVVLLLPKPREGVKEPRERGFSAGTLRNILLCLGLALALFCLWAWMNRNIPLYRYVPQIDPSLQLRRALADPSGTLRLLFLSLWEQGLGALRQMVGVLGWVDTVLPMTAYIAYSLLLLGSAILDGNTFSLSVRLTLALLFAGTLLAVFFGLYLVWTPLGWGRVVGVQGRYFLPMLPLLGGAIGFFRCERVCRWIPFLLIPLLFMAMKSLMLRYYAF